VHNLKIALRRCFCHKFFFSQEMKTQEWRGIKHTYVYVCMYACSGIARNIFLLRQRLATCIGYFD